MYQLCSGYQGFTSLSPFSQVVGGVVVSVSGNDRLKCDNCILQTSQIHLYTGNNCVS